MKIAFLTALSAFIVLVCLNPFQSFANQEKSTSIEDPLKKYREEQLRRLSKAPTSAANEKVTIDGKEYLRSQLIWDFINTSLDDSLWLENTAAPWLSINIQSEQTASRRGAYEHWWSKYVDFSQGLPARGVINKWDKELQISIGWPNQKEGIGYNNSETGKLIEIQIKTLIPELSKATGLKITFVSDDLNEDKSYAKVRIIPITETNLVNRFKTLYYRSDYMSEDYLYNLQRSFISAVAFTPYLRSSVDGYFIPDLKNNIDFSVCKILDSSRNKYLGPLISECLLRALGLPGVSKLQAENALLSNWNVENDKNSLVPSIEGNQSIWFVSASQENVKKREDFYSFSSEAPNAAQNSLRKSLNSYDLYMLKLLYCPEVKKGAERGEIIESLLKSASCF